MAGDVNIFKQTFRDQLAASGRAALSAIFPRDIEYYMVALELTTFEGDTIDYFSFPVMPSALSKVENERTSIYHTLNGTTIINSDSFVPKDLTISGDFGRAFKLVIGNVGEDIVRFRGVRFSNNNGVYYSDEVNAPQVNRVPDLNFGIKSGYGCIKILQSIIDRAKGHDNGNPFRLYFYNPALGESYLVVPTKTPLTVTQNEAKNMIWSYTLNLAIVAPLDRIEFGAGEKRKSLTAALATARVQESVNAVASSVTKYF